MRFLILNTDYPAFVRDFYAQNPGLADRSYREQLEERMDSLFGVADFYSSNLRALGHEAHDILMNNAHLQGAWAREHGAQLAKAGQIRSAVDVLARKARRVLPPVSSPRGRRLLDRASRTLDPDVGWLQRVVEQQIEELQPDIVLNQDIGFVDAAFLAGLRRHYGLLVGQIASPIPTGQDFRHYDLMLSSLPNLVDEFRRSGVRAELHRLGFDPRVLERLSPDDRSVSCSFVGQLTPEHSSRLELLEQLCARTPLEVWAPDIDVVARDTAIKDRYRGPAWGLDMYRVLARSQIAVNHHLDLAGPHANNLRLYEATGVGSMLLTDAKSDLAELFVPGQEVVAYGDPAECAELIAYYLANPDERDAIARSGQRRTLEEHNYRSRMAELVAIVERHG